MKSRHLAGFQRYVLIEACPHAEFRTQSADEPFYGLPGTSWNTHRMRPAQMRPPWEWPDKEQPPNSGGLCLLLDRNCRLAGGGAGVASAGFSLGGGSRGICYT